MSSNGSHYVCILDEATQKKALEELYEDPKNRQGAIDTFRDWIKQQKHIKCPTDDMFLLGFLRAKHFSQLEARQALEAFMKGIEVTPEWTKNLDPADPDMLEMIERGMLLILPKRDRDGRRIIVLRYSVADFGNKKEKLAVFKLFALIFYYNYLCDETTQVHGTVFLGDMTSFTMANNMKITMDERKRSIQLVQKTFPARLKGMHLYNGGPVLDFFMTIIKTLMVEKLQKRVFVHPQGLESLYKQIPRECLPEEYLPDDYNDPNKMTKKEMIAATKAELCAPEIRDRIKMLSSEEFYIKMAAKDTDVPVASFRKLNVD